MHAGRAGRRWRGLERDVYKRQVVKEMTMLPYSTQSSSMASVAPSLSEMGRTNSSPPIVRSRPSSTVKISIMVK